ncbi:proline-rich domain-containing protein, partial [Streptomyces hainanensis]|uniref:proline-rich domain-containing protein n=1 Tax=Streptomyces hainanensis TaxID=402648 RepID=UPI001404990B
VGDRPATTTGGGGGGRSVSDLFSGKLWDINPDLAMWRALEELGLTHNAPPPAYFREMTVNTAFTPNGSGALNSTDDLTTTTPGSHGGTTTTNTTEGVSNINPALTQGTPLPGGQVNVPSQVLGPPPGHAPGNTLGTPPAHTLGNPPGGHIPSVGSSSLVPPRGLGDPPALNALEELGELPPPPGRSTGPLGGSSSTGGPLDSSIVRVSETEAITPAPRPLGPQGAHSRSVGIDGLPGVRVAVSFDDAGGVTQVQLIAGNNAPITATRGVGDPADVFRAQQNLGGGVTRDLSFRVDGDGVELLSMDRTATLTDARFGQVDLQIDDLAPGGPTVTGATRPDGAPITAPAGDTAGTVRIHHDLGGGISRDWTVRITDAQPTGLTTHRNVDLGTFPGFGGTSLRFNETAGGAPVLLRTGADGTITTVDNAVTGLGTHINGHHLITAGPNRIVVDTNGAITHHVLPVPGTAVAGAPAGGHHVFVPVAGTAGGPVVRGLDGQALGGVTPHPQVGGGTRLQGGGVHVSLDATGTQLSRVFELTGHGGATRNVFAHVPVADATNPAFRAADGTAFAGIARQADGNFQQVAGDVTSTYNPNGTLIEDLVHHRRGPLVGQDVTVPNSAPPRVGGTPGVAHGTTGTFRVPVATGPHALVNQAGELVGTATQFVGRNGVGLDAFGHLPVPPGSAAPVLHAGNGAPIAGGTVRGGLVTVPNGHGNTVHAYDGSLQWETFRVNGGGANLNGHDLLVRQGNTVATITPPGGHRATASATVTEQFDQLGNSTGLRLDINGRGLAIDNQGRVTHDVLTLNQPGQPSRFAFVDTTNPAGIGLRNADGTPAPNVTLTRLPSGEFTVATPGNDIVARFGGDGAFQFQDTRLPGAGTGGVDQFARMRQFEGDVGRRAYELLDNHRVVIPDRTVLPRPQTGANANPGFRVNDDGGVFRLYRQDGHLDVSVAAPDATTNIRNVTLHAADGGAPTNLRVLELSDGVDSRYLDITNPTNLQLRGGELTPITTHGTIHTQPGGYRVDGFGARANEWADYSATGKLTAQRIDVFHQGQAVGNQHFLLDFRTNPDAPTWTRNTGVAGATPPRNPGWNDFGKIDVKGGERGHISLTSHSGTPVFDRRMLPDGNVLDSHVAAPSLNGRNGVPYGPGSRDHWSEIRSDGNIGDFGRRKWSVSGRAWVDYDNAGNPVRHFRENPQGGHVIADMRGMNAHYWNGSTSNWTRFDGDFKQVADGTRKWSPGRAWIDTMDDAATGETKVVHQKISRVAGWGNIDHLRRYHAHDINANGSWSNEWKGIAPTGKEVGGISALKNGDLLTIHRIAEQRPPNAWRSVLSSEYRHTDLGPGTQGAWAKDSRMQIARWEQTNATGVVNHGIQFTSQQGNGVFRIGHAGDFVGETRKLTNGNDLTVGDNVKLPDGVTLPNHYQPWSEGAGKLEGHRSFDNADFGGVHLPPGSNKTAGDVLFVDRFRTDATHANPFTPTANAADWRIARVGFKDGTILEYKPRPMENPAGTALDFRRTGHQGGNTDWQIRDPHGTVVARQDTFGTGGGGVQIRTDGPNRWIGTDGSGGARKYAANNDIHYRGWDRHSFQDFDANNQLVREHRLLAGGVTVDGWRLPGDAHHPPTWRWNKTDTTGEVQRFGNQDVRVRRWYDGDTGQVMNDWKPGARWADHLDSAGAVRIQEIPPYAKSGNWARDSLTLDPWRVREYAPTPNDLGAAQGADAYRAWKEFDAGITVREMKRLSDGSFLESETWQKQWRRHVFGAGNTHTVVNERTIAGSIFARDTFGTTHLVGRETHFIDFPNEFRGFTRAWGEPLLWRWGPAVTSQPGGGVHSAESLYTPFLANNMAALAVGLGQEFVLDFLLNLAVFGIVSAATGTPFTLTDVQQAAFNAAISAGVKSLVGGLSNWAGHRGAWKSGMGSVDQGNAWNYRQNDENVGVEFAGNEKVLRWRAGTYDFFLNAGIGTLAGFASGAAGAAIFGVKDSEGNRHQLEGGAAAFYGLAGALAGLAGAVSIGAVRGMMQNTMAARLYHRAGVIDFLVMPVLGKLMDKSLLYLVLGPQIRASLGITAPPPPPQPDPSQPDPNNSQGGAGR